MPKKKQQTKRLQGKVDTRCEDTGIFNTYCQYFVGDDGTEIPVGRFPIQSHKLIRKGEVLAHIAAEVQGALDDGAEFKGEAKDAAKMIEKLKTAMAGSDVENVLYWAYFLGRAMERHHVRQHERNAKIGKDDQGRRREGGAATTKVTPANKGRICELMRQQLRSRVSRTAASVRVASQLVKEGLEISSRTVRDTYAKAERENA